MQKVNSATQREIEQHLQLNANIKQTYKEKAGKNNAMKDLHNIKRMKMNTEKNAPPEIQGIEEWMKEPHPGVDCEFINDSQVLE